MNYFKLRLRYGEYDINLIVSDDNHKALIFILFDGVWFRTYIENE